MKSTILLVLGGILFWGPQSNVFAKSAKDYPMRVEVYRSRWHGRNGWREGFGRGNLISQQPGHPQVQGIDFNWSCTDPVRTSFGPDSYPARYGKNPLQVIVAVPEPGSTKLKECTLQIELKDYFYVRGAGHLIATPLQGGPSIPVPEDSQQESVNR